jgi:hypothetical protein
MESYAKKRGRKKDDIVLVQKLLQHSTLLATQRYMGISIESVEKALRGHVQIESLVLFVIKAIINVGYLCNLQSH